MAPVQPNIQWPKAEEGVGRGTGTSGAGASNNAKQRFQDSVSKRDGRGKAGFSSKAGSRGSCCQAFGNRKKKVMSKRGKTSARLNPSQLRPQQNLLLHRIPELNAINPGFQKSFSSSRGIGLPPQVRILALTRTRCGWSRSLRQPGAPPASRGGCWAAPGVEQHHLPVSQAAPQQYLSHA